MKTRLATHLNNFFYPETAKEVLGFFRIVFATLILVEALWIRSSLAELFGINGFLDASLMKAMGVELLSNQPELWSWTGMSFKSLLEIVYFIYVGSTLSLLIGFKTRTASITLWLTQAVFMNSSHLGVYGVDRYYQLLLFLSVFCPWGESLSVDSRFARSMETSKEHGFWLRLFQIAIVLTYTNAGIAKSLGSDWWTGTAIFRAVHLPEFYQKDLLWLANFPLLPKILGWMTILTEALFGLILFSKRIRWILAPLMIGMHIGIALFMGLYLFGVTMIILDFMLFLLPDITRAPSLDGSRNSGLRNRPTNHPVTHFVE